MTVAPHSFDADEFHDSAEPHASAEPASPAAVLKDIRFSYDRGTSWALDGVSLTVHAGERLCLVGPNGSGKSTLARLIAGLTAPDGGEVTLLGQRVYAAGPNADAYRAARHGIGMVFQNPEDQLVTTVLEDDVAFGPENLGLERELIGERIVDSLQAVGLANLRQSDPTRMSGGQQQRASIAGMLAMNPAMLVLDEPTAMLDESARAEVMRILDDLQARGTTIVHVTHHPDETVHADRIVHMEAGRIIGITAAVDNRSPLAEAVSQSETEGSIGTEAAPSRPTNDSPRQREREDGSELPLLSDGIGDMTNPIIRVSHLTYRYPSAKRAVIDDLSFTIARGETVALMGVNGSGKSTLVRMLCALTAPTAGSIEVAGVPVASTGKRGRNVRPKSANRKQLAQLRRHVGYVMQHPEHQLFADTVAEDVAYGPRNQGLGETEVADRVRESLELLHIGHLADRSPFDLSGGKLEVPDDDYGIWYVDMMDNPDRYEGVEVSFKAIMCHSKKFKGVHCPGRFAMVCCDKDMQFLALVCRGEGLENFKDKEWVKIHATVKKEKCDAYQGEGPVLYVTDIAATTKPDPELVSF